MKKLNCSIVSAFATLLLCSPSTTQTYALTTVINNVFDLNSGANTYLGPFAGTVNGMNNGNWVGPSGGLSPVAGNHYLTSGNGNANITFAGYGIRKLLGGTIVDPQHAVSFSIGRNYSLESVELSDFTSLRIGGAGGTMQWTNTPKPTVNGQWLTWTGIYTPSPADIGMTFYFEAIWNLPPLHTIALDGPVTVTSSPIPEPAAIMLIGMCASLLFAWKKVGL